MPKSDARSTYAPAGRQSLRRPYIASSDGRSITGTGCTNSPFQHSLPCAGPALGSLTGRAIGVHAPGRPSILQRPVQPSPDEPFRQINDSIIQAMQVNQTPGIARDWNNARSRTNRVALTDGNGDPHNGSSFDASVPETRPSRPKHREFNPDTLPIHPRERDQGHGPVGSQRSVPQELVR